MRRIVVSEFVSLDGVMEDPGGAEGFDRGGWAFQFDRGPEGDQFKVEELFAAEAMLLGRVTYAGFAQAWPGRTDEAGFADKMNSMPKYVVSNTLSDADASWTNTTVLRGDGPSVAAQLAELKRQPGGDILVAGSCQLAASLIDLGLVDELRLMVFPLVIGAGKRLFPATSQAQRWALGTSATAGDGVLILTYHPAAATA